MRGIVDRAGRLTLRLGRAKSGLAMVEFAFLLPIFVILYFGTVGVTQTVIAKRKLSLAVSTLADLASRADADSSGDQIISKSYLNTVFLSSSAVMAPLDTSSLQMRISSVIVYPLGLGTCVDWSVGSGMNALKAGSSYTVPSSITSSMSTSERDFIIAEGVLPYQPISNGIIPAEITLSEGPTFVVPRQADRITADSTVQKKSKCK